MSDPIDNLPVQDELAVLKARADALGISYHPSIGVEKLREKVNAALKEDEAPQKAPTADAKETESQRRNRLRQEASKLVRIRLTCMNPHKKEWQGEFITAGNSVVGTFTKYIPFNADEGWHVPHIIYEQLRDRECQVFVTVRDSRGNATRKGKTIKEFAIEVLPPLTEEELKDLAQRQAMAKSVD
jgi:hypothetical protein